MSSKTIRLMALTNGSFARVIAARRFGGRSAFALASPDLFESLEAVAERSIDKFVGGAHGATGCFMMNTAMVEAAGDPEISQVIREAMDSLERALIRRLERAIDDGQLPASADPRTLAMILVANHYEISARARAGYAREELRSLADRTLALVRAVAGIGGPDALARDADFGDTGRGR